MVLTYVAKKCGVGEGLRRIKIAIALSQICSVERPDFVLEAHGNASRQSWRKPMSMLMRYHSFHDNR
jgi:hypothetical protein